MRQFAIFLFYLLILLLPTQLARHFFFDFSLISGIRSDYLAPTVYLTDIIVLALTMGSFWSFWGGAKRRLQNLVTGRFWTSQNDGKNNAYFILLLFVICYLLFNSIFIAANHWAAFYKSVKILEFILLGFVITKLKPKLSNVVSVLSIGVFYSSVIAIWQFAAQKSLGGIFWFLGERTFNAGTPGIAAMSLPAGGLLLRPYATFPHPNVLGGFLAVVLPLLFYLFCLPLRSKILKIWLIICLVFGLTALILSSSRVAWMVAFLGFIFLFLSKKRLLIPEIKQQKNIIVCILFLLILLSIFIPLLIPDAFWAKYQYWQERVELMKLAIPMAAQNMVFGVGLNNSIIQLQNFSRSFPGLFIYQPTHNIFLLILVETGILGFIIFLWGFIKLLAKVIRTNKILMISIIQLFFLGLFDHYLFTLQQGQLLLTVFVALSFVLHLNLR